MKISFPNSIKKMLKRKCNFFSKISFLTQLILFRAQIFNVILFLYLHFSHLHAQLYSVHQIYNYKIKKNYISIGSNSFVYFNNKFKL